MASVIMSGVKSSLRSLALTPERIPDFFIPSRSPLILSSRPQRTSLDRTRLLSDHDDDSPGRSPPVAPPTPATSRRFLLRLPSPRIRRPHRAVEPVDADTDLTTQAAMSLPHVGKLTTPYGFRAVLAASPCTCRRESLFHQNKPVKLSMSDRDLQEDQDPVDPPPGPSPSRSLAVCLQPARGLGLQVMKELKRSIATLKAPSPANRRTRPH
ncbi:C2 calcium-dependent domain-containing protein 4C-like isoform 1-T1 [Acanthopagrus schlegelii]